MALETVSANGVGGGDRGKWVATEIDRGAGVKGKFRNFMAESQ